MENIITAIILGLIAIACFIISCRQFHQKGFLLNNSYIYAKGKERESMDKKPYYKQSGIVFILIGIVFLINTLEALLETGWLFYFVIAVILATITYAIVSSVLIEKHKKR